MINRQHFDALQITFANRRRKALLFANIPPRSLIIVQKFFFFYSSNQTYQLFTHFNQLLLPFLLPVEPTRWPANDPVRQMCDPPANRLQLPDSDARVRRVPQVLHLQSEE